MKITSVEGGLTEAPKFHLTLVEPPGYAHSRALADPLVYMQSQLLKHGAEVTASVNELSPDAINVIFGAHLGFETSLLSTHRCIIANFEQTGGGGANLTRDYLNLLESCSTVDYHPDNVSAYGDLKDEQRHLVELGFADYLSAPALPLERRPIDLLFVGCLTERRVNILGRLESQGVRVSVLTKPLYGPERDELIRSAKAVLNISAYESTRFEQVRASVVLSLGTPLISERRAWQSPTDLRYAPFVHWFDSDSANDPLWRARSTPAFIKRSDAMLDAWRNVDASPSFAGLLTA